MEDGGNGRQGIRARLFTAAALIACVVIAGIIISSMKGTLSIGGGSSGLPFNSISGAGNLFVAAMLVILILLLFMQMIRLLTGGLPQFGGARRPARRQSNLTTVLMLIIVALSILFILHYEFAGNLSHLQPAQNGNTTGISTSGNSTGGSDLPASVLQDLVFTLFIPIVGSAIIGSVLIVLAIMKRPRGEEEDQLQEEKEAIVEVVGNNLAEIESGKDPRSAVIEVYSEMRNRLGRAGAWDRATFTAREFGKRAIQKLNLTEGTVDDLTHLYEEAKFSIHPITEKERDRAIGLLQRIVGEMTSGG